MGLKVQPSFSGGELDPVLQERTTLQKYKDGLSTARNTIIGKTGSVLSRPGRTFFVQTKLDNRSVRGYSPNNSNRLIEWGHQYVRIYNFALGASNLLFDVAHDFTESDLSNIHFETSTVYVYIFCAGKKTKKLNYITGAFVLEADVYGIPPAPLAVSIVTAGSAPTGYRVDYLVTYFLNGEESFGFVASDPGYKLPINVGESNFIEPDLFVGASAGITQVNYYRRPASNGAFGYIGSSSFFFLDTGDTKTTFFDNGQAADYTHSPPVVITTNGIDPINLLSKTGVIYQQRLLVTDSGNLEAILASRTGFQNNFLREFPLSADSALKFKAGSSGYAKVLRMLEADGLVVFTSSGIFLNTGPLDPDNLTLNKRGRFVINERVPPIAIPGGVLFVDQATNTIRNLVFSLEANSYRGEELSTYSNHLFFSRQIVSWAYQEGNYPLLWVTFDDGTFASFTYEADQQMRAWTRHDSVTFVESVVGTGVADKTFFVVKNGTKRYFELTIPRRYIPAAANIDSAESDKGQTVAAMDSVVSYVGNPGAFLFSGNFTLSPVTPDNWGGLLNVSQVAFTGVFTSPGPGDVGTVLRVFDAQGTTYDLTVTSRTDDSHVTVFPSTVFPSDLINFNLYLTSATVSGLAHLEGEYPAVIVDGGVVCSPNNDDQNYTPAQVVGGVLTLPGGLRGAIVHVGHPITADVGTLKIDTVEQSPTLIESLTVNKLYLAVVRSSGLYVAHKFPANNKVAGMVPLDQYDVDYSDDDPIIGNRAQPAVTKRIEMTLPGDWKSQGEIAIRQVDPLHFEILSIIPDSQISGRGR